MTTITDEMVEARKRLDELLADATWAATSQHTIGGCLNLRWCDLAILQAALPPNSPMAG